MLSSRTLTTRPATPADRHAIQVLTRHEQHVHMHLDWKPVEDWLGAQPFVVAERGNRVVGALACPPDLPDVAWVRLIVIAEGLEPQAIWKMLWPLARQALTEQGRTSVAGLSLEPWTAPLYESAGFVRTHDVVVLSRLAPRIAGGLAGASPPPNGAGPQGVRIRPAYPNEHPIISEVDDLAFAPPWQLSPGMIRSAIAQAEYLSVAELDGCIIGYQLSTPSRNGVHLARLAVRPEAQGRGVGEALVRDLIHYCDRRGSAEITVNTQHNNHASLAVYRKLGFESTGARLPVYQLPL